MRHFIWTPFIIIAGYDPDDGAPLMLFQVQESNTLLQWIFFAFKQRIFSFYPELIEAIDGKINRSCRWLSCCLGGMNKARDGSPEA